MQIKKYILLLASVLFVVACSNDDFTHQEPIQDGPVKVGFWMGKGDSENTRTFINDDGRTISWEAEDKVALWAQKDGAYTFQNQTFDTWFVAAETNQAFFTTTLPEAMPEGTYTYYACYPKPQSVSGTTATFTLPSMQDGKMGGGADIMVAQGTGPALEKLYIPEDEAIDGQEPDYVLDQKRLSLNMSHLVHALRFYVPQAKWGFPTGETVERIVFTMPANVAGTVTADVSNTNGLTLTSGGTNTISLNLKEPIGASTADNGGNIIYDYAVAAILPPSTNYESNDKLVVKTYSQSRVATQEISLNGRGSQAADEKMRMAAGRVTPVGLNCLTVTERPKISFRIASNNLGEQPYKITLTSADTNTKWKAGDDHEYEYYTGSDNSTIAEGSGFDIYYDEDVLSTISGKSVTVTYESKSAIVTETITMPTMSVGNSYNVNLNVPYLMYQDFSTLEDYNDEVTTGAKSLNIPVWNASRSRSSAGSHIRLRPFWVFGGRYQGRLDSEFFGGKLKNTVTVEVKINAGAEKIATPLQVGKTTTSGAIEAGTDIESVSTTINLPKGSNSTMPEHTYTVDGITSEHRLSWRTNITSGSWVTYSDTPIDNIRVKIK